MTTDALRNLSGNWVQTTTILILGIAAGTLYLSQRDLPIERPEDRSATGSRAVAPPIPAWADPIEEVGKRYVAECAAIQLTVVKSEGDVSEPHNCDKGLAPQTLNRLLKNRNAGLAYPCDSRPCAKEEYRIVPVLLPGTTDQLHYETRLRIRYAINASLSGADFNPKPLNWFLIKPDKAQKSAESQESRSTLADVMAIPFEVFERQRKSGQSNQINRLRIVVLWLSEEELGEKIASPHHDLVDGVSKVIAQIEWSAKSNGGASTSEGFLSEICKLSTTPNQPRCVLIGPTDSGNLIAMLRSSPMSQDTRSSGSEADGNKENEKPAAISVDTEAPTGNRSASDGADSGGGNAELAEKMWNWLTERLDEYLDFGTGPENAWIKAENDGNSSGLSTCLGGIVDVEANQARDSAINCFQDLSILDSNPNWESKIADEWLLRQQMAQRDLDEDWIELVMLANRYLDEPLGGLEIARSPKTLDCAKESNQPNAWTEEELTKQRDNIIDCLEQIDHADSDPDWSKTVAAHAQIRQLLEQHSLVKKTWQDWFIAMHDYLDDGLSPASLANKEPWNCIKQNEGSSDYIKDLSSCLAKLNIIDSDQDWTNTLSQGLVRVQEEQKKREAARNTITGVFGEANQSGQRLLLLQADRYLDSGIEQHLKSAQTALEKCEINTGEDKPTITFTNGLDEQERDAVVHCLDNLEIDDSDPDWESTIVAAFAEHVSEVPDQEPGFDQNDGPEDNCRALNNDPAENKEQIKINSRQIRKNLVLISPRATMPHMMLLDAGQQPNDQIATVGNNTDNDAFSRALGIHSFERSIVSDDLLICDLVRELNARGVTSPNQIALVHEGGNPYANSFAEMIRTAFSTLDSEKAENAPSCPERDVQEPDLGEVQHFTYSRKLDGVLPGSEEQGLSSNLIGRLSQGGVNPIELPRGAHQLDYLRRLAANVSVNQGHNDCQSSGPRSIRAVGIITPDIYDKRLVLRAMRQELDDVLFFTTDLDADLLRHAEFPWLRNLLVASAFPLSMSLENNEKNDTGPINLPPFRDSYQTSYQVALLASGLLGTNPPKHQPILIEVGKSGPVQLSVPNEKNQQLGAVMRRCGYGQDGECDFGLFPPWGGPGINPAYLILVLPAFLFCLLFWRRKSLIEELIRVSRMTRGHIGLLITAAGVGALLIAVLFWISREEPLYFFEGISAVPGLMLRFQVAWFGALLLVLALVVQRIYVARAYSQAGLSGAMREPDLADTGRDTDEKSPVLAGWMHATTVLLYRGSTDWDHQFDFPDYCPNQRGECDAEREHFSRSWATFRRTCRFWPQLGRAAFLSALVTVLLGCLGDLDNITPFVNGYWNGWILRFFTYAGLFVVLTAIVHSLDEFRILRQWIVHLTYREPLLPDNARVCQGVSGPGANLLGLLRIVAYISQMGYRSILVPVMLLFLFALSYARLFEGWPWPDTLTLLLIVSALALFWAAFSLLQAATAMRRRFLMKARYCRFADSHTDVGALEAAILGVSQGVFRPTWQNPTIGLVLIQIALTMVLWLATGVYV